MAERLDKAGQQRTTGEIYEDRARSPVHEHLLPAATATVRPSRIVSASSSGRSPATVITLPPVDTISAIFPPRMM
jgi:hypothetical protein